MHRTLSYFSGLQWEPSEAVLIGASLKPSRRMRGGFLLWNECSRSITRSGLLGGLYFQMCDWGQSLSLEGLQFPHQWNEGVQRFFLICVLWESGVQENQTDWVNHRKWRGWRRMDCWSLSLDVEPPLGFFSQAFISESQTLLRFEDLEPAPTPFHPTLSHCGGFVTPTKQACLYSPPF